jgi:ABC-2 type transport system permease protein
MNTPARSIPEPAATVSESAPAAGTAWRQFYWSVRRELWESRSLYIAPLAFMALGLMAFSVSLVQLPGKLRDPQLTPTQVHQLITEPFNNAALLLMASTFVVAIFYCLDALTSERRDRSILFWKSLPVSDSMTVIAKFSVPMIVVQLCGLALTVVMHVIMLMFASVLMLANGLSVAALWDAVAPITTWLMLLYHYAGTHALWYAPIYAWLLLISAWARRVAFLWAVLPLVAIYLIERLAFKTTRFLGFLEYRFAGAPDADAFMRTDLTVNPLAHLHPGEFVASPGLSMGLLVAAIFLALAVRLRRYRTPI